MDLSFTSPKSSRAKFGTKQTQSWRLWGRITWCTTKGGSRRAFLLVSPLVYSDFPVFLAVGTNGSPPRASSNTTRPTFPFRRTSPGRKLLSHRPVPLPPKHRTRLAVHKLEEGGVRRAGAARKGAVMTTTGLEGPRCAWSCQTH